jgi:hypothetical protein
MTYGCGIPTSPLDRPFDLSLSEGPDFDKLSLNGVSLSCLPQLLPLTNKVPVDKFGGKHPTMPRSVQRPWLAH